MSDVDSLCSTIATRPDNNAIGSVTHLLNTDASVDHEKILDQCGKYLSGMNLEEFFELIYKKSEVNLIEKYLLTVDDISEKQLVQALNITFDYLAVILGKRYDYWSLTHAMKSHLNASKSVELGEQLVGLLVHFQPPTASVVDWLCALIDAHFSSFVLAKWNKIPLIEQFVQDRLTTFDLLQGLNSIKKGASTATSSAATNKKTLDNLYTLQRIHFK